jgi:hypothetical protein
MRNLGNGQTVTFLASDEVISLITQATGCISADITSKDVIIWAIKETWKQLQGNLPAYIVQGHSFARREAAWKDLIDGKISHQQLANRLCDQESRTLRQLYGPDAQAEYSWIQEYHSPNAPNEISQCIYNRCKDFREFSLADANLNEEQEIELIHEREVERVVEQPAIVEAAGHHLHEDVIQFVATGSIPKQSKVFLKVDRALLHTSVPIPHGTTDVFENILVTEDFYRTIQLPASPFNGCMDNFIRPVDWLVTPNVPNPSHVVAMSPFEVNELFEAIKSSQVVRLHPFIPRHNLSMRSFEDFNDFTLPNQTFPSLPPYIVHQVNLFGGSIFIRDYKTYRDICKLLGLYFDKLNSQISSMDLAIENDVIDSTYFVLDPVTRSVLGMDHVWFQESPVPFLRCLFILRRHGQTLGPSHFGKLLQGSKLKEEDFVEETRLRTDQGTLGLGSKTLVRDLWKKMLGVI